MKIGDEIILKSFNGKQIKPKKVYENENYWLLIGQKGRILEDNGDRFVVLFYCNNDSYGLENHNPIKNSLFILKSDLKILD